METDRLLRNSRSIRNSITAVLLAASAGSLPAQRGAAPHLDRAVTMYEVWAKGSERASVQARKATTTFVANGDTLSEIVVDMQGGSPPKIHVLQGDSVVAASVATLAANVATARFQPPLAITPGEIYRVHVESPTPATFQLAHNGQLYLWDNVRYSVDGKSWLAKVGGDHYLDLNMIVKGTTSAPLRAQPTQRALLVLLENGGVSLTEVDALRDLQPVITYYTCGDLNFELKKDEQLQDLLARVANKLGSCLECVDPKNWVKRTIRLDGWIREVSDLCIEEIAKAIANAKQGSAHYKYDKVVVIEDKAFHADKVLAELRDLAPKYQIDVHVLAHGRSNAIVGGGGELTQKNFFLEIARENARGTAPIRLRAVYQMNCVSGTLVKEWLTVGADVVNGTREEFNNMMPPQYFGFLKHWLNGEQFDESVRKGWEESKLLFQILYARDPSKIEESRTVAHGRVNLRITD